MKSLFLSLVGIACVSSASATTIIAAGGLDGYQFGFTTTDVAAGFTPLTASGDSTTTIAVGSFQDNIFNLFAPDDTTPPSLGNSGALVGKWSGNASDNSSAADAFAGSQIWFRITTTIGGQTYTGYFSDAGILFPANDGGFDDTQTVASYNLDTISPNSTGNWTIDPVNQQVSLAIPEPSISLLGALGFLCLLRRKR